MSDCLFCRMVAGEIPADVVHETDRVLRLPRHQPPGADPRAGDPQGAPRNVAALAAADPGLLGEVVAGAQAVALQEGLVTDGGTSPATAWSPTPARRRGRRCTTCTSTCSAAATWAGRPADSTCRERARAPRSVETDRGALCGWNGARCTDRAGWSSG